MRDFSNSQGAAVTLYKGVKYTLRKHEDRKSIGEGDRLRAIRFGMAWFSFCTNLNSPNGIRVLINTCNSNCNRHIVDSIRAAQFGDID